MKPIKSKLVQNIKYRPIHKLPAGIPSRTIPLIWLFLGMLVVLACSSPPQAIRPVAADDTQTRNVVTRIVKASVLITAEPQDEVAEISGLRMTPPSLVLDQNEQIELSAEAVGDDDEIISDVQLIWSMADHRAGTITREGQFQAGSISGVFNDAISVTGVQNTVHGVRYAIETIAVTVVGDTHIQKLSSIALIPDELTVLNRQIYRLRAVGYDEDGLVIPEVSFTWEVNDTGLGHVNDIGYLTVEGSPGTYSDSIKVTGELDGEVISATTNVTVIETLEADDFLNVQILPQKFHLDPQANLQLRAVALNGLGEVVEDAIFRWDIVDSDAGSIDSVGMFRAGDTPGIFTESVRVQAIVPSPQGTLNASDFASVVIRSNDTIRTLDGMRVFPNSIKVRPKGKVLLGVESFDDLGKPAKGISINWDVLSPAVGTLDELGQFIAGASSGIFRDAIEVTVEQDLGEGLIVRKTETVDVTITGTLRDVTIKPNLIAIAPGRTVHFSVTGEDENGVTLPGLIVKWDLVDDTGGYIDHAGNFTAGHNPGTYADSIIAEVIQNQPN